MLLPCLGWATDIHLDHLGRVGAPEPAVALQGLARDLLTGRPTEFVDAIILTGDISNAHRFKADMAALRAALDVARQPPVPIYFVLGNHDFYGATVQYMRDSVAAIPGVVYLPYKDVVQLTINDALVGIDGWADGRVGNPATLVELNDSQLILNVRAARSHGKAAMWRCLRELADADATKLARKIRNAISLNARRVIVATHVPPFRESAWHQGQPSDDQWAPFFVSKATGDVLMQAATANPTVRFTVLCGHSHGGGVYSPVPNMAVHTGHARYGFPAAQLPIALYR